MRSKLLGAKLGDMSHCYKWRDEVGGVQIHVLLQMLQHNIKHWYTIKVGIILMILHLCRTGIIYTFLISISAFKISRYINIVTPCHSPVYWLCRTLNFENRSINTDLTRTFVNKHNTKMFPNNFRKKAYLKDLREYFVLVSAQRVDTRNSMLGLLWWPNFDHFLQDWKQTPIVKKTCVNYVLLYAIIIYTNK